MDGNTFQGGWFHSRALGRRTIRTPMQTNKAGVAPVPPRETSGPPRRSTTLYERDGKKSLSTTTAMSRTQKLKVRKCIGVKIETLMISILEIRARDKLNRPRPADGCSQSICAVLKARERGTKLETRSHGWTLVIPLVWLPKSDRQQPHAGPPSHSYP